MNDAIPLTVGGSQSATITWPDGAGGAANLTGYDVAAFDVHPDLAGHITVTMLNAATGQIAVKMLWAEGMPVGQLMHFRIRLTPQTAYASTLSPDASPRFMVHLQ